jgi:ribonuclease G
MKKVSGELNGHSVVVRVNPDIARALKDEERAVLRDIERVLGQKVLIRSDIHLHHEQFDVMTI